MPVFVILYTIFALMLVIFLQNYYLIYVMCDVYLLGEGVDIMDNHCENFYCTPMENCNYTELVSIKKTKNGETLIAKGYFHKIIT